MTNRYIIICSNAMVLAPLFAKNVYALTQVDSQQM